MTTFPQLIPNVDDLLALHKEELAEYVLKLAAEQRQNNIVHLQVMTNLVSGHPAQGDQGYPANRRDEALGAIAEAWNWLLSNGFIIPDFGMNGSNGFVRVSRTGARVLAENNYARQLQQLHFPKSLLHHSVADAVWGALIRGDFEVAVFSAFKAVEVAVRKAGGFPDTEIGVQLVSRAFHPENGSLTDQTKPMAEREALANLFAGAIGSYKNPHSHRTVEINEPLEAQEQVLLASHLLRIVESRAPAAQQ